KSVSLGYDAAGNLSSLARGPVTSTWIYDKANRLTSIMHDVGTGIEYGYGYDNASRITHRGTVVGGDLVTENQASNYDASGQLRRGTGSANESYDYNDNGNRVWVGSQSVVTNLANRLTNDGTYTYDYDKEGNLTKRTRISTAAADDYVTEY